MAVYYGGASTNQGPVLYEYNTATKTNIPVASAALPKSSNNVLGVQTQQQQSTGSNPYINPATGVWDDNYYASQQQSGDSEAQSREAEARGAIESGYGNYFSELDAMLNEGLPAQQTAQQGIAQSQYTQGVNTLTGQKEQGIGDLGLERGRMETRQSNTLKDLADNIRNAFMAGNVYLGARGAGDSSAANQYSYALTKLGTKQRGDILSQFTDIYNDIGNREFKIKNIFDTESKNLQESLNQKIYGIAQWFSEQQNALRQAKAQGQLAKGQDLASLSQNMLNVALQQLANVRTEVSNRRSALEQWAVNNSQNIAQLKQNMQSIGSAPFAQAPNAQPLPGISQSTGSTPQRIAYGGGGYGEDTDIFGNPIRRTA